MTTKSTKTNHYTYIIRHTNGRYYVGRRSTKKDPLLDPYMGPGKWVKSIKDRSTLSKTIIAYYPTFDELKVGEMELIEKYFLDEYCMNMLYSSEGAASGSTLPEETKKKISDALSGDKNYMYGKRGELCPNYGSTRSEQTKKNMSDAQSGDKHPMYGKRGELCPNYGNRHTEQTKQLFSEQRSGEKHHRSNITNYIAKMIKIIIAEGSKDRPISEEFDTTIQVVSGIRHGSSWKHITI